MNEIEIQSPSLQSLFIRMRFQGEELACATAFIVRDARFDKLFLITNRHNVTGRNNITGNIISKTGGIPTEIEILHNKLGQVGQWVSRVEQLFGADGEPLWIEHPSLGARADFIALPLTKLDDVDIYAYDPGPYINSGGVIMSDSMLDISPAAPVSVVGFPFGLTVGGYFAVWATGFIASEPNLNYEGLPIFLIDCRARKGQSGSAVILHSTGSIPLRHGGLISTGGPTTHLLGVYSGRVNDESDLGMVWKASAINELLMHASSR